MAVIATHSAVLRLYTNIFEGPWGFTRVAFRDEQPQCVCHLQEGHTAPKKPVHHSLDSSMEPPTARGRLSAEVAYTDPPSSRVSVAASDMNSLVHRLPHISPEGGNVRWLQSVDEAKDTYLRMRPFLTKGIASVPASPFRRFALLLKGGGGVHEWLALPCQITHGLGAVPFACYAPRSERQHLQHCPGCLHSSWG